MAIIDPHHHLWDLNTLRYPWLIYTDHNLLEDENWRRNFGLLARFGLSFDLQIYYQQMKQAAGLSVSYNWDFIMENRMGGRVYE